MNEKQMQEMAVSILLDEYTQLDVAQLLKEYEEDEENGEAPNVSDALDETCNQMIQREFSKKKHKKIFVRISKVLSRVAMVTLMLIGLCTVSVLSVKAWREPALRFVLETFDRYSTVGMEGENIQNHKTPEEILKKLAEIIPEKYVLVSESIQHRHSHVRYVSSGGEIINVIVATYPYENYYDTESAEGTRMQLNGFDVVFVDKNGYKVICLDEEQKLMIELGTVGIREELFWDIVHSITK